MMCLNIRLFKIITILFESSFQSNNEMTFTLRKGEEKQAGSDRPTKDLPLKQQK